MIWLTAFLLGSTALGGDVRVTVPEGGLRPGLQGMVLVAVADDRGRAPMLPPVVRAAEADVFALDRATAPGVWAFSVTPSAQATVVRLTVLHGDTPVEVEVPVAWHAESTLTVPRRIDGRTLSEEISFVVSGSALPPPEALRVSAAEGTVLGVEAQPDGSLRVRYRPEESRFPRYVPMLISDTRSGARPAVSGLRLWARPRIDLQTEPGTKLRVHLGSREYGPFVADDLGIAGGYVDQYPGEMSARAVLTDEYGNESEAALPLSTHAEASLVAQATGQIIPGRMPPEVWVRAIHGDGHAWEGRAPACRTSGAPELPVAKVEAGLYVVRLPDPGSVVRDLRVHCALGGGAEASVLVAVAEEFATSLSLKVFPEELSNTFPIADMEVILQDAEGARLSAEGVRVRAGFGEVELEPSRGVVLRGEYRGYGAVEHGYDVVVARYDRPLGEGAIQLVEVGHGDLDGPEVEVYGRALDASGRPVAGVDISLGINGVALYALTQDTGWAVARIPVGEGSEPLLIEGRAGQRSVRALALRGAEGVAGPGRADFEVSRSVRLSAGRVGRVQLAIDPPVLYTDPNAVAFVRVRAFDRAGQPLDDAHIEIIASEGVVGPLLRAESGDFVAEYTPIGGDRARTVSIVARTEGDLEQEAKLVLEPRPLDRAVGLWVGGLWNFGQVGAVTPSIDLDWRLRGVGQQVFLRGGVGFFTDAATIPGGTGVGEVEANLSVVPFHAAVSLRRELGGQSLWMGVGGVVAPYTSTVRFDTGVASTKSGILTPGLLLLGGFGRRMGLGEIAIEVRANSLTAPGGEVVYTRWIGGVSALVGYRFML